MEFDDIKELLNKSEIFENLNPNKWEKLMNFITKTERNVFRHSLHSINNGLYLELHNMIKNEVSKRMKSVVIKKICGHLNLLSKESDIVPKLLDSKKEGIFWLDSFLSMSQKKAKTFKRPGLTLKKKHISFTHNDSFNSNVTTKFLENVNHEKLNLLVDNLRKISKDTAKNVTCKDDKYFKSPLAIEIDELKQRRDINRKKLNTSVCSPQEMHKTKRAEVFFKDAIARRLNKDFPKLQR